MIDPLSREKLQELLAKMGARPRDLMRTNEALYRELNLGAEGLTDDQLLDALVDHPELVQRPIIERGERAVLARPVECARGILSM